VLAGTERLLVEFVRRNAEVLAGLTMAQLWSLAMMAGGTGFLWVLARRGGLRVPVADSRVVATA
jgi:prolipoprotein diacylglyceryltransferase